MLFRSEKLKCSAEGIAEIKGWENTNRKTELHKVPQAVLIFKELIRYYGTMELLTNALNNKFVDFAAFKKSLSAKILRSEWLNVGGQLIQKTEIEKLKRNIKSGKVKSWVELHEFYRQQGLAYQADRLNHGYTSLLEILHITPKQFTPDLFKQLLQQALDTKEWMCKNIFDSRAKDYSSPFRKMVYDTNEEMNKVMGRLEDNSFIQQQLADLDGMKKQVKAVIRKLK